MSAIRIPVQRHSYAKPGEHPMNVNSVMVMVNEHEQMRSAPIELHAGCSWASLDIEAAREVIRALTSAIETAEKVRS